MKKQIQKTFMQGIKELHIKILQSDNISDIGNYLQEVLDKLNQIPPDYVEKLRTKYWKDIHISSIISILKTDINSILDGTYKRAEIARHKATLDIAWMKKLFTDPVSQ